MNTIDEYGGLTQLEQIKIICLDIKITHSFNEYMIITIYAPMSC